MNNYLIFKDYLDKKKLFYTPCSGIIGTTMPNYNEYIHTNAKIFFSILDKFKLEYYVFAGTSIGYVRNKSNIPWVDDYDIIVFDKDIQYLTEIIFPILLKNGFYFNILSKTIKGRNRIGIYQFFSGPIKNNNGELQNNSLFQCDIFPSYIKKGFVRNYGKTGLYHKKNIPYDFIYPSQRLNIDDMTLPFFNKIFEDVKYEYGDVINECCIHIGHKRTQVIKEDYKKVYDVFFSYLDKAKRNTIEYISQNKNHCYENNFVLNSDVEEKNILNILKDININNTKNIFILDEKFVKYSMSIKYYFPDVIIYFYMFSEINSTNLIFLNYVDVIRFSNENLKKIYNDENLIFIKKPQFEDIIVITFGTFDLFHIGHFNILKRSKDICQKLIVGISSDDLNLKKGKKSVNNTEKRINDAIETKFIDEYFIEESLEKKDEYIKKYNANLLVMGDDWLNKFNWVSCPCIYFPRTPDISSTLLKKNLGLL